MTDKKSQHYVPQFYLKNFSDSPTRRTINLFNFPRQKLILGASLRQQCCEDYFYDRSNQVEDHLGAFEGLTSSLFRSIIETQSLPSSRTKLDLLYLYLVLQHQRTQTAVRTAEDILDEARQLTLDRWGRLPIGSFEKRQTSLRNVSNSFFLSPSIYDLKGALISNLTTTDLITSDNPLVLANPFYRTQRLPGPGTGLASAGLLLLLPISPRLGILMYDGNVYHVLKDGPSIVNCRRSQDMDSLNDLQTLNAQSNLYFFNSANGPAVVEDAKRSIERRVAKRASVAEFVESNTPGKYVREESADARQTPTKTLIGFTFDPLNRDVRLSFLRRRVRPKFDFDGSAVGAVRDLSWLRIVNSFSKAVRRKQLEFDQLREFAVAHPEWEKVGNWKARLLAR